MEKYMILLCHTDNKQMVMDALMDANQYELVNHNSMVDCWYEVGDTLEEQAATDLLVNANAQLLEEHYGIKCEILNY